MDLFDIVAQKKEYYKQNCGRNPKYLIVGSRKLKQIADHPSVVEKDGQYNFLNLSIVLVRDAERFELGE